MARSPPFTPNEFYTHFGQTWPEVKYSGYTPAQVQAELQTLFGQQYILTITVTVEVRHRAETDTGRTKTANRIPTPTRFPTITVSSMCH